MNKKTIIVISGLVVAGIIITILSTSSGLMSNLLLTGTIYPSLSDEKILQINNTKEIQAFYNTYGKYDNNIQPYRGVDPLLNYDATHGNKRISVLIKGDATDQNSFTFRLDCDNGERKYFVDRHHGADYLINYDCFEDEYP